MDRIFFFKDGKISDVVEIPTPKIVQPQLMEFECPECHNNTFGRFEPFVKKGVKRWCSSCEYSEMVVPPRGARGLPESVKRSLVSSDNSETLQ